MPASQERFCSPTAIARVRDSLRSLKGGRRICFLTLSGSFNPVHRQHLRILALARKDLTDLGWTVVGGFLAPSTDTYVRSKLGKDALPVGTRIRLCELAVNENLDWASVCQKGEAYSVRACSGVKAEIESGCRDILNDREVTGIEVMGSDTAARVFRRLLADEHREFGYREVVYCLLRRDQEGAADSLAVERTFRPAAERLGIELVLSEATPERAAPMLISSTAIRKMLADRDWETLRGTGWLPDSVFSALREWRGEPE